MSIYDEAIETLENSKACTGYPCDYPNVIQALERAKKEHTELEALKRDVKRYFELDNKHGCTLREIDEWLNLERKLMKVGKEE